MSLHQLQLLEDAKRSKHNNNSTIGFKDNDKYARLYKYSCGHVLLDHLSFFGTYLRINIKKTLLCFGMSML